MVVIWSEEARADLQDIFDFIAEDSPLAALLVDERICRQTDELALFPNRGRAEIVEGTRELVIQRTPYIAVYRVEDAVVILAVVHGAEERIPLM